jgi:hypothetical protein
MPVPVLLPTNAQDETFGGVTYHVQGELVPALHIELGSVPVFFEHHILLWKDPSVEIGVKSLSGAFKRVLSGMPVFMTEARGIGGSPSAVMAPVMSLESTFAGAKASNCANTSSWRRPRTWITHSRACAASPTC